MIFIDKTNKYNGIVVIMALFVIMTTSCTFFLSNASGNQINCEGDKLEAIRLYRYMSYSRILNNDTIEGSFLDSLNIYQYRDIRIYKYDSVRIQNWMNDSLTYLGAIQAFFVCFQGKDTGYMYYAKSDSFGPKRSMKSIDGINNFMFNEGIFALTGRRLVRQDSKKPGNLHEIYVIDQKPDNSYSDSSFYDYSKVLNKFDYSFRKELDSIKGMKLHRVRKVWNAIFSGPSHLKIPSREMIFEFNQLDITDKELIMKIIKKIKEITQDST